MKGRHLLLLLLAVFLVWGGDLLAGYQDLAIDMYAVTTGGEPLVGDLPVTFRVFADPDDQATGDYILKSSETETFTYGFLHASISMADIAGGVPDALWLEITIDGDTLDLIELNAVPWALRAGRADSCDSLSPEYLASPEFLASLPAGVAGADGTDGADGAAGPAGAAGVQGIQGIQGVQGIPGPVGNYVESITDGAGITGAGVAGEGVDWTLSVDQAFSPNWTGTHTWTAGVNNTPVNIDANATTSKNALSIIANGLTSGYGIKLVSTSNATAAGVNSSDLIHADYTADFSAIDAPTVSGNLLDISRTLTGPGFGNGISVTGEVLKVVDDIPGGIVFSRDADTVSIRRSGGDSGGGALNITQLGSTGPVFRVNNDGTLTDSTPFVVAQNGYVGMGTAVPDYPLDIYQKATGDGGGDTTIALRDEDVANVANVFSSFGLDLDIFTLFTSADTTKGGLRWIATSVAIDTSPISAIGHFGVEDGADGDITPTFPAIEFGASKEKGDGNRMGLQNHEVVFRVSNLSDPILNIYGDGDVAIGHRLVVVPPAIQTIVEDDTIADDACGGVKMIDSAGVLNTNDNDTFTTPDDAHAGCCMYVINAGGFAITLKNNANFKSAGAADVTLGADDAVQVCFTTAVGGKWYQVSPVSVN